jgi:hypothetical protein
MKITVNVKNETVTPTGNWNVAKDWFPSIDIDQKTKHVTITTYDTIGRQKKASIETTDIDTALSTDGDQLLVTGEVDCRNWQKYKTSGSQKFVFAIFLGDSGHIYVHRAPATKGWLGLNPDRIRKRLVKLGIGAEKDVIQQGDFLLKPANGSSLPIDQFKHEWTSSSHHQFSEPVLSEYVPSVGRLIYIPEGHSVELIHEAVDGIQHPTVTVPSGQWIIGSTASSLYHTNDRD